MKLSVKIYSIILILFVYFISSTSVYATENKTAETLNPNTLYAKSAVLMDGSSGRVLYEKNGEEFLSNASTTKILTCIVALEHGNLEDIVTVSSYAASMPDVQMHIREGENYRLEDLLYSLMLESHNDSAVAIAEHIGGDCRGFSDMMNQKAKEIGCKNTYFLTPNGLDATETITEKDGTQRIKNHGTTAIDLALIMRYCIKISEKKDDFLRITETPSHSFYNKIQGEDKTWSDGNRNFSCQNHNSFLQMMEGAISGKTGFTGKAGYCYVGALKRENKVYIVALLACGWPGNKTYKWSDTRKLMSYGLEMYDYFEIETLSIDWETVLKNTVNWGKTEEIGESAQIKCSRKGKEKMTGILLKEGEQIEIKVEKEELNAPVQKGQKAGIIFYNIDGETWLTEEMICAEDMEKIDYQWCIQQCLKRIGM